MKRLFVIALICVAASLAAGRAVASECVVGGGAGSFEQALSSAESGGCVTDQASYRDRYNEFFPGTTEFRVIRWQSSEDVSVSSGSAQIESNGDRPLVLIADPSVTVKFTGGAGGLILKGSRIIIDHITIEGFSGDGIRMRGDGNLFIRSRVLSNDGNGIFVTGKDNRIVDTEVASNGINGILVGGEPSACSEQFAEGKGTVIAGCSVHDNGAKVSGTSCADAVGSGSCQSLKREAEACFDLLGEEPTCDEPSVPPDDSCGRYWNSVNRCRDLWSRAGIGTDVSREDAVAAVYNAYPGAQGGSGIVVDASGVKITSWNPRQDSGTPIFKARVYDNRSKGIYVNTLSAAAICRDPSEVSDLNLLQTVLVSETPVDDLFVSRFPLPVISQLSASEGADGISVTGNIILRPEPWYPWNGKSVDLSALRAEVFMQRGDEVVFAGSAPLDSSGRFVVHVATAASDATFTAAVVDTEHGNTSPFAGGHSASPSGDDDSDGLTNDEEDLNHNGIVDPGETDPINPDTDGDGLLDGEEKLHNGRIAELIAKSYLFADLNKLDPLNPDSDGDCLPDGLELGVSKADIESLIGRMPAKPHLGLSAQCQAVLKDHTVSILENAIPYNATVPITHENISMLYDMDPEKISDPTSNDSDSDGMRDGSEDFNFNGRQDSIDNVDGTTTLKETDPAIADSDGDGIPDGEEGDKDGDGKIGPDESDPVFADTDGDGVSDGQERRLGTYPNACDSDEDGLSDGVEVGAIKPAAAGSACHGLEAAGTNYKNPHMMDPLNPDSDNDGLMDGVEDANANGWIEAGETDPSDPDTDRDGLSDGVEARGDFDGDGIPDFDVGLIKAGPKCSPPSDVSDVDCDGVPNAVDVDSDNDGCPDALEGGRIDSNANGIPDLYDSEAKDCTSGGGGGTIGGGGSVGTTPSESPENDGRIVEPPAWLTDSTGGGACSLVEEGSPIHYTTIILLICPCLLIAFRRIFLGGGNDTTHRRVFLLP